MSTRAGRVVASAVKSKATRDRAKVIDMLEWLRAHVTKEGRR